MACHAIKAQPKKDAAGDVVDREYKINQVKKCVYEIIATPHKMKATWSDAGSFLSHGAPAADWDFATGLHKLGHVRMANHLIYGNTPQHQGILPEKIAIFRTEAVEVKKDQLLRLV